MLLSIDLRKRVIAAVDRGIRVTNVANTFKVSRKVIYNWLNLRKRTGNLEATVKYQKGHSHTITDWDQFKKFAEINKYCTIDELVIEWNKSNGTAVKNWTIQRALKKIGFTFKKKPSVILRQRK